MLRPRTKDQRSGLDRLIDANRPDLSVEALVISDRFRSLFSPEEIAIAANRLGEFEKERRAIEPLTSNLFPDELPIGPYPEGAKKTVRVNRYERSFEARRKCIEHYGCRCAVCEFCFTDVYGALGDGFIHVHHLRPLALNDGAYQIDPISDLRPVCPNCHAMLHRPESLLTIEQLRSRLRRR